MTIEVSIFNRDQHKTVEIAQERLGEDGRRHSAYLRGTLKPHEQSVFILWPDEKESATGERLTNRLVITESKP